MTAILKFCSFTYRSNYCSGSFCPYALNLGNSLTSFGLPEYYVYFFIKKARTINAFIVFTAC